MYNLKNSYNFHQPCLQIKNKLLERGVFRILSPKQKISNAPEHDLTYKVMFGYFHGSIFFSHTRKSQVLKEGQTSTSMVEGLFPPCTSAYQKRFFIKGQKQKIIFLQFLCLPNMARGVPKIQILVPSKKLLLPLFNHLVMNFHINTIRVAIISLGFGGPSILIR